MTRISLAEIAERFPREEKVFIAAHENPDGDALGCVIAVLRMAENLGIPATAFIPGTGPFPPEYRFLPALDRIERGEMPSLDEHTTAYILDCATAGRLSPEGLRCAGTCINIDHHQDNTRFATYNHVDPSAASTTELLFRIFSLAGLSLGEDVALGLYVGLVTDTGRFQYSNTSPAAHRMAADMQEAGVCVNEVYRHLYESVPLAKVLLAARAHSRLQLRLDGRLALSWLEREDFEALDADESYTEGIIDGLRSIDGVRIAALLREQRTNGTPSFKGSLRSTDGSVDVAAIAHVFGGGGHVQAAGFSTDGRLDAILDRIEREAGTRL